MTHHLMIDRLQYPVRRSHVHTLLPPRDEGRQVSRGRVYDGGPSGRSSRAKSKIQQGQLNERSDAVVGN